MFEMRDLIPWSRRTEATPARRVVEHPLATFQREVDRLFEDFWRGFDLPAWGRSMGTVSPRIDVRETDEALIVSAELPGMDQKDVEIVLSDDLLTLKGEKRVEHEEKERGYTYQERSYGAFERRIPIDTEILSDKVEATFEKGVLTITLPKSPEAKKHFKRIEIKGAAKAEKTEEAKAA